MIPVILSGGSGTRLWPLSRNQYPKQFLALLSERTLLQETVLRLGGLSDLQAPVAVCNEQHRFLLAEQLHQVGCQPTRIILEPMGKNTAPALALAALSVDKNDVLLVLPSDHVITNTHAFQQAVIEANALAEQDFLVTFGIVPDAAETGYGYIKRSSIAQGLAFEVAAFVEKPDAKTAQRYIDSGDYFWNSGMFAFKAGVFLQELQRFNPQMLKVCTQALQTAKIDTDFTRIDESLFATCPADSIDYAVMEKTQSAVVIPLDAGWSDIGSWTALAQISPQDSNGNSVSGDVLSIDSHNSFIYAQHRLVSVIGLQNLIVVETNDAVMIASKERTQDVKTIVEQLKQSARPEAELHRKIYRPWGHYDLVDSGENYKTKRIVVNPKAKLSLQKHQYRAEHWVVVKGTALVTKADKQYSINENESIYIPLGVIHRLENPTDIPLEIVEVQSGSYLGEDDIIRFGDSYGRI
jgi:mannose-1-phosphate guanylyltransferase/mannose-1-phosphate guanylyltransferase/mannose-6-phosphate isomerase